MTFLERISGMLTKPVPTFRLMLEAKVELIEPLMIVFLASLSGGVASLLTTPSMLTVEEIPFFRFDPAVSMASSIVSGILLWLVGGLFLYGVARLLEGRGTIKQTLLVLGYTETPIIYSIVFGVIGWATSPIVYWMFLTFLLIWASILSVMGVRHTNSPLCVPLPFFSFQ